jgi:thioesterase domain-containing protein
MQPQDLEKYLRYQIPLVDTIGVKVIHATQEFVKLQAPLEPNRNHLGTAFGGSTYSISVLACYTWLFNLLDEKNIKTHVVIKKGQIQYFHPVNTDMISICKSPDAQDLEQFLNTLGRKKRAKLTLKSEVIVDSQVACQFEGEFVSYDHS